MTSQPNCSLRTAEPAWEGVSDSRESDRHLSEPLPWGEDGLKADAMALQEAVTTVLSHL